MSRVMLISMIWAHPRSRGENRGLIENLGEAQGSSPLTRGKPRISSAFPGVRGLIPAHAGKTVVVM